MFSPTEEQVSILLLKYNLDEIETALVTHHLPVSSNVNEDYLRSTEKVQEALREARSANAELEDLKVENSRLTARLEEYQRECKDIEDIMKTTSDGCDELTRLITPEKAAADLETSKYEAAIQEVLDKFRQTADVYNEEKMRRKTNEACNVASDVLAEEKRLRDQIDELKSTYKNLTLDVPINMLEIVGKSEIEKRLHDLKTSNALCNEKY